MNFRVLERLCIDIREICDQKQIDAPILSLVTNGTIINKTILNIIRKYRLRITVSLDGLADINDLLRVYPGGGGSFRRITSNIRTMKQETGQPAAVESTFTSQHLARKFSLIDFMDYLTQELSIHSVHIPLIIGKSFNGHGITLSNANIRNILRIYSEAIHKSIQSLITSDIRDTILISYVERYLRHYFGEHPVMPYLCSAGIGTLSVTTDGAIYPCFMFINRKEFKLCKVGEGSVATLMRNKKVFSERIKSRHRGIDRGRMLFCAGINYESKGHLTRVSSREVVLSKELYSYLEEELLYLFRNQETEDWIKTKIMLFRLWQDTHDVNH